MLGGIGTIVKHKIRTIASMGRTAFKVSLNFSFNFERLKCNDIERLSVLRLADFLHKINFINLL